MDKIIVFIIGWFGYPTIELLWRGHTHWSMALAGGISFYLIYVINTVMPNKNWLFLSFLSAVAITAVELTIGFIVNINLKMNVWDYSNMPLNFLGQICFFYFALWFLISIPAIPLCQIIRNNIKH